MSEWCQNKKCPEKKNKNQIRGSKGNKYYQSKKAVGYLGYWCSHSCREKWFDLNREVCVQSVGIIGKKTIPLEDAWYVQYDYNWNSDSSEHRYIYTLKNRLKGVNQIITREQAQTPEQLAEDLNWQTIDDAQARELAVSLGLAS